jgi:hypothetical protein
MLSDPAPLVPLRIGSREWQVPAHSTLLRCFQYLRPYGIGMGGFCWNADCHTCEVTIRTASGQERSVLSCQTLVEPETTVVKMTEKLRFCLRDLPG